MNIGKKKLGWEGERSTTMVQMTALLQNFYAENQSPVWRHEEVGSSGSDYFLSVEPLLMEFVVLSHKEARTCHHEEEPCHILNLDLGYPKLQNCKIKKHYMLPPHTFMEVNSSLKFLPQ